MNEFSTVIYRKVGAVAYISLNRPRVLNAYNMEMRDEVFQVLQAVKDDPEVESAIIKGEGRAFCAGADLTEFGTAPSLVVARSVRWERDVWGAFLSISKPLIAAVHGYCLGSGLEIAMLCDLRIASGDAVFGMPEVGLGMIPAAGGTQTLPRHLGVSTALELLLTGRQMSAAEALEMGLISAVVGREALDTHTEAVALRLLSVDQSALRAAKEAVLGGADMPLPEALELEGRLALRTMGRGRT